MRASVLSGPFWRLWTASTASNVGDGVLLAALPLLAASLTSDPVAVSMVTVAAFLPWLVFGLPAGLVVDRVDRRTLMWVVDVGRGLVLAVMAAAVVLDRASLPLVYVSVLALGIGETLFDTAAQSVVPAVVSGDALEAANGRLFAAQITANGFVGPPLGGWLFAWAATLPFLVDGATFLVSAALILTVRGSFRPDLGPRRGVMADVAEGLVWLWRHPPIRAFAIAAAVINIGYAASAAVLVLFAGEILDVGGARYGLLLAGGAVGSVAGTILASWVVRAVGRVRAVLAAVAALSAAIALTGATSMPWLSAIGLATFGLAGEVWNVVAVSYRQAAVPDRLLGRVMAAYRVIAYGAFPVGAAAGGLVAARLGLRAPFIGAGAVIGVLLLFLAPVLRGADLDHPAPPPAISR